MKTTTLLVAALIATTALVALAPAAEARQACTFRDNDCYNSLACVYNRVTNQWDCVGRWDPCNFRCWDP